MPETMKYLDCCDKPDLENEKLFLSTDCEMVAIRRCLMCGCHWFYRLQECPDITDGYDRKIWYVRLDPEETDALLELAEAPEYDYFADRLGFLMDETGMNSIQGIPYFLL